MNDHTASQELLKVALNTSPGALASALTWDVIVAGMTVTFLFLQIAYLIWKWRREAAAKS